MILGSGLIQSGTPAFGTLSADSSDSALLAGQDALVAVYDGASYLYFGKAAGVWKTLWVDTTGGLLRGDEAGTYAVALASDGPAPFDVAGAFATDVHAGSVSAGTSFVHEADALIEFVATTLPSANQIQINFRKIDTQNRWYASLSSGALYLVEVVENAGVNRAIISGTPVANGDRNVVIADSNSIEIYVGVTRRVNYPSAANFATATAGEMLSLGTGGAVSNIVAWPRIPDGTIAAILNKASA